MKCSAVRKDFWCLTNKVNQIIKTLFCSSVTLLGCFKVLNTLSPFAGSALTRNLKSENDWKTKDCLGNQKKKVQNIYHLASMISF